MAGFWVIGSITSETMRTNRFVPGRLISRTQPRGTLRSAYKRIDAARLWRVWSSRSLWLLASGLLITPEGRTVECKEFADRQCERVATLRLKAMLCTLLVGRRFRCSGEEAMP